MSEKEATATYHGGPAFPTQTKLGVSNKSEWITEIPGQSGMTLRDYFAAKALMVGGAANKPPAYDDETRARQAYELADAMLKARDA